MSGGLTQRHGSGTSEPGGPAELSTELLRLLHSVAAAANEASSLDELVPVVLDRVCAAFGWGGGALLRWPGGVAVEQPEMLHVHGSVLVDVTAVGTGPGEGVRQRAGTVLVPLSGGTDGLALLFSAGSSALDPEQRNLLQTVGIATSRVVERHTAAALLQVSQARFRSVFDLSPLAMGLTLGYSGTYAVVNQAYCDLLGRSAEELVGTSAADLVHPDDAGLVQPAGAAALAAPDGRHQVEMRLLHASGAVLTALVTLAWLAGPDGTRNLLAQVEDITARRTAEELLRRQAEQDALTGLANRARLTRTLDELARTGRSCDVVFVDLDGLKTVNDTRGHDVGDEILVEVAKRLREVAGPEDLVARYGGDEFVLVCPRSEGADEESSPAATEVARRIRGALTVPVPTAAGAETTTASIGLAGGRVDTDDPHGLLQQADDAMYRAKQLGRDRCQVYDAQLHRQTLERRQTEALLHNALEEDRFVLHYQPIVDLRNGSVVAVEALVRLRDREGNLVPPGRFIAVAEQTGLIVPLGTWVLEEGCRAIARIRQRSGCPVSLSVNVAARQVARPDLTATVDRALAGAGLPEQALAMELTESALLEADDQTLQQLEELRGRGVMVGLDDFGTGYSSLTYLRRFPVTHLKVDRSFVQGMVDSSSDRAIVRAVTGLAEDLGLHWVAEGIERPDQREAVTSLGDGLGQGFLFGRPVPEGRLDVLRRLVGLRRR